jgi:DNA-binding NarL/FixJ family response regulator
MTGRSRKRIYVFESEPQFQALLEASLAPSEVSIDGFSEPQAFLDRLTSRPCDLLILDSEGRASDRLDMLERARRMVPWMQSLVIVEQGGVSGAIRAIKAGAGDCLDKPVKRDRLVAAVEMQLAKIHASPRRRPRALTAIEVQILQMVLAGKTSLEMANELHRSKRTIDVHRKNIMRKLQATGLVDLIKRALGMGFTDHSGSRSPDGGVPKQSTD